jgi:ribonuclease P protein component
MDEAPAPDSPPPPDARYRKRFRLRRRAEFLRVQQKGRRQRLQHLTVLYTPAAEPEGRFGITVSKKVGHAPARALVKRRLREIYRTHRTLWPLQWDVVVVAGPSAATAPWQELRNDLLQWLQRVATNPRPRNP